MEHMSPNKKIQKAITLAFLRCMASLGATTIVDNAEDHAIYLLILAFFFAMRTFEIVKVSTPGRTKLLTLGSITFLIRRRKKIEHDDSNLSLLTMYVCIVFVDQKNGE